MWCKSDGEDGDAWSRDEAVNSACEIRVRGVVQGVGFRPFVFRLAQANTLAGWVLER